jgi:hypothetical protein
VEEEQKVEKISDNLISEQLQKKREIESIMIGVTPTPPVR